MDPADGAAQAPPIRVEVAFSPEPGRVQRTELTLPAGATLAQALARCGFDVPPEASIGVWGRPRVREDVLRDRDRVEICRPLRVDPKEARRQRYRSHRDAKKA